MEKEANKMQSLVANNSQIKTPYKLTITIDVKTRGPVVL